MGEPTISAGAHAHLVIDQRPGPRLTGSSIFMMMCKLSCLALSAGPRDVTAVPLWSRQGNELTWLSAVGRDSPLLSAMN